MMDAFDEAKRKAIIRVKGVSCHGLPALTAATRPTGSTCTCARINHRGHHMDGADGTWKEPGNQRRGDAGDPRRCTPKGRGIIGMKLVGNGDFTTADDRERALQFALTCGCVDADRDGLQVAGRGRRSDRPHRQDPAASGLMRLRGWVQALVVLAFRRP